MAITQLPEDADLQTLLAAERLLLFKHSPSCPISARAFFEYRGFCEAHPEVTSLWLHVIDQRSTSLKIAEVTGVSHESPQALWIQDGVVIWHASHGAITQSSLKEATAKP